MHSMTTRSRAKASSPALGTQIKDMKESMLLLWHYVGRQGSIPSYIHEEVAHAYGISKATCQERFLKIKDTMEKHLKVMQDEKKAKEEKKQAKEEKKQARGHKKLDKLRGQLVANYENQLREDRYQSAEEYAAD